MPSSGLSHPPGASGRTLSARPPEIPVPGRLLFDHGNHARDSHAPRSGVRVSHDVTDVFLALKSVFDEADISKIMANLELYGSPEMQAAHKTAFEAWRDWFVEFVNWQKWSKRTGPGHEEERAEAVRETTKRWPNVEKLAAKADEAYDELVRVMRAKAVFEPVVNRVTRGPNRELPQ